ncbi:MAG: PGPGW domain-containing protein [Actinobacteria bacterium]|nr:PGPGW domain-containing protein [Actinomycetota bacterium]MCA1721866.1 PGPGW domain-containing protein [Actinomycetota bacterium]
MSPSQTGFRAGLRRTPGGALLLKVAVLVLGGLFVALGIVLIVLPGPLTIPPVLLGVYIWSTEFAWAERLRERVTASAREAWRKARLRPVSSAVVTGGGLLLVAAALVAIRRYDVVDRVTGSFG